jgi:hypothetical protein
MGPNKKDHLENLQHVHKMTMLGYARNYVLQYQLQNVICEQEIIVWRLRLYL